MVVCLVERSPLCSLCKTGILKYYNDLLMLERSHIHKGTIAGSYVRNVASGEVATGGVAIRIMDFLARSTVI